jgi:hypothetical protein
MLFISFCNKLSTKYLDKYNWSLNWLYTWFLLILKNQCLTGFWVDTNGAGLLTLLWQMVSLALIVSVSAVRAFVLFNLCVCNRSFDQTRPTALEARTIVRLIRPDPPHSRREQSFVWSDQTYRTRGENNCSFDQTRPTILEARTIVRLIRRDLPHSRREHSFVSSDQTYHTRGENNHSFRQTRPTALEARTLIITLWFVYLHGIRFVSFLILLTYFHCILSLSVARK